MLPAVLELLGAVTWRIPPWLDRRLPHFRIEGEGLIAEPAEGAAPEAALV
jgi:RND superfamily putative drug exporter